MVDPPGVLIDQRFDGRQPAAIVPPSGIRTRGKDGDANGEDYKKVFRQLVPAEWRVSRTGHPVLLGSSSEIRTNLYNFRAEPEEEQKG
jgi:hypothetical protein